MRKVLFVWDFDYTVVNCNSDEYVPAQFLGHAATSDGFRDLIRQNGTNDAGDWDWHKCVEIMVGRAMNADEGGATPDDILAAAARMPYLDQVQLAIGEISEKGGEHVGQMILSDGNTLFIQAFLQANGMQKCFNEGTMTNIGEFVTSEEEKPALKVTHQSAKYGGHKCPRCASSPNLCKTQALEDMLGQMDGRVPARIVYVGDGANDACPALNVLRECDILLARRGVKRSEANGRSGAETDEEARDEREESKSGTSFGILPALEKAKVDDEQIPKCHVAEWSSGADLRSLIGDVIRFWPS